TACRSALPRLPRQGTAVLRARRLRTDRRREGARPANPRRDSYPTSSAVGSAIVRQPRGTRPTNLRSRFDSHGTIRGNEPCAARQHIELLRRVDTQRLARYRAKLLLVGFAHVAPRTTGAVDDNLHIAAELIGRLRLHERGPGRLQQFVFPLRHLAE